MRWLLLLVPCGGVILVVLWLRGKFSDEHVSEAWLRESDHLDGRGFDGICWKWPVDKVRNESGLWNAHHERRRA